MNWTDILGAVNKAVDLVQNLGLGIINLLGKGKVDETELARMKYAYDQAVQQLNFSLKQAEMWLAEKMMVGAPWIKPLSLVTAVAIVVVCAANILLKCFGLSYYSVQFESTEMLILIGMFVYVTSGSNKILLSIVDWLMERRKANDGNKPDGDKPAKTGG